jgi:flagellar hook protein FlgE
MPNSLLTGISGLRGHQKMLEVVGNNLANLNTTAFKSSRVLFSDMMYQTQRNATSSSNLLSSMNAIQIGTGSTVSQVDLNLQQGNLETTERPLDLAINGGGFFVGVSGNKTTYTRAGTFKIDEDGFLSDPSTGNLIQRFGTAGEQNSVGPSFQKSGDNRIYLPIGAMIPGSATQVVTVSGNLAKSLTGPVRQTLITSAPFLVGGVAADLGTNLNDLDLNSVDYGPVDTIRFGGFRHDGTAPNPADFSVTPTTTVGDLITALNTAYSGATVTLDAQGNIVAKADNPGPSSLQLSISDLAGNVGHSRFDQHDMVTMAVGKDADTVPQSFQVFDVSGTVHTVNLAFTKQADGTWNMKATVHPSEGTIIDGEVTGIEFREDGSFAQVNGTGLGDSTISIQFNGFSTPQTMSVSFGEPNSFNGLTQAGLSTSLRPGADGSAPGKLNDVHVDTDGTIYGLVSNGSQIVLAQLAIASFQNPDGLLSVGNNYFQRSLASGDPEFGTALNGSRGEIRSGQLEGSNVDLALEFTRLIIAQRGFSANARTITVTDQILQELTNLIR